MSLRSDEIPPNSVGARLLPKLLDLMMSATQSGNQLSTFLGQVGDLIAKDIGVSEIGIVQGVKGQWRNLNSWAAPLPVELLVDALDSEEIREDKQTLVVPLEPFLNDRINSSLMGHLLLFPSPNLLTQDDQRSIAAALVLVADAFQKHHVQSRRAERLEALLEVTARWNQSEETDQLLLEMAEASTRLLNAERASIFLPDKKTGQLVGRPALGVEGGEIRIPANVGVVGQVMQTGEPQRVDHDIATEQAQINREVDEKLDFQTHSLICVPITDTKGKTIGAFELINKKEGNFTKTDLADLQEMAAHAAGAISTTQHVEKLVNSQKNAADQAAGQVQLIGECPAIIELRSTIERVAGTELVVLITGENGTGKEVVAQLIHYLSDRRDQILVAVNCAAITESLLESELFGHEKGAFTDAHEARAGKFELADGGTLFLDEIGDMTLGGQAKLLRVLEERIVVRVGGSSPIPTSARVIAATNQNLPELVTDKKFREDLFFRLNVLTVEIPPLRDRGQDIVLLGEHFLNEFCKKARREKVKLNASAKKRLLSHNWPGNVRELRNMMERLAYLSKSDSVGGEDLEFIISPRKQDASLMDLGLPLTDATKSFQCEYIRHHIDRAGGNMTDAAQRLGLHRSNLYRKMRQLGMSEGEE